MADNIYSESGAIEIHTTEINNIRSLLNTNLDNCQTGIQTDGHVHPVFRDHAGVLRDVPTFDEENYAVDKVLLTDANKAIKTSAVSSTDLMTLAGGSANSDTLHKHSAVSTPAGAVGLAVDSAGRIIMGPTVEGAFAFRPTSTGIYIDRYMSGVWTHISTLIEE